MNFDFERSGLIISTIPVVVDGPKPMGAVMVAALNGLTTMKTSLKRPGSLLPLQMLEKS